jgi:uncharacterized protein (TIGR02246 family)
MARKSAPTAPTFVGPTPADQAAVWAIPQRIVAAWAENDADAFADVFADDGTMILPGLYRNGRESIRAFMAEAFAGPYKGTRVTGQPINIKFLGREAVLLITMGGVLAPGESEVSNSRAIRASWLVAKQPDGQWRLAAYQNCPRDGA